jgi:hypothetical protein
MAPLCGQSILLGVAGLIVKSHRNVQKPQALRIIREIVIVPPEKTMAARCELHNFGAKPHLSEPEERCT